MCQEVSHAFTPSQSQLIMSLTLARSERVRNLLTHANLTELVL